MNKVNKIKKIWQPHGAKSWDLTYGRSDDFELFVTPCFCVAQTMKDEILQR